MKFANGFHWKSANLCMMRLAGIIFLIISLFACRALQKPEGATGIPGDFSLLIRKTGCLGNCPVYTIHLNADGLVKYEGEAFVELIGSYEKRISLQQVKIIYDHLETSGFWQFDEVFDNPEIADLPQIVTICTARGKTHAVVNRFNAPEEVIRLQTTLDNLIGDSGYKPSKN